MEVNQLEGETEAQACNMHNLDNAKQNVGPSLNVHDIAQEDVPESTYRPWVVVTRKKQGTKHQRHDGTPLNMRHGQPPTEKKTRSNTLPGSIEMRTGLSRDSKRKLSPQRVVDRPQIANVVQRLVKEGLWGTSTPQSSFSFGGVEIVNSACLHHSKRRISGIQSMEKRGKFVSEDYISNLSSETLVSILSQLTLREAVATSILGRRWRYLWTSITILDFDATKATDTIQSGPMEVQRLEMDLLGRCPYNALSSKRCRSKCKRLWRSQSCGCSSEQFCLNLLSTRTPTFCGFKFLKDLYLKNVGITQEVIEYFLANCPKLEQLSVCGSRHLVKLRVSGSSLSLKHLEVVYCTCLEYVEIFDTSLISFKYAGLEIDLFIKNVPLLVDLYIGVGNGNLGRPLLNDYLPQFSRCLSQLQVLTLELIDGFVDEIGSKLFPRLKNLKKLVLEVGAWGEDNLLGLTPLINACPYLQILELKMPWINVQDHDRRKMRRGIKCRHEYLKVLEIYGYAGRVCEFEFVMYFIRNAVALEKILIDPRDQIVKRTPFASANLKFEQTARCLAKSQLEAKVPPSIQLVIL
ncbi:hypothetical protein CMV_014801 [Castanea mollissima]|uniref:At1g61320/AtMIF1 LRR domain-containing protein n=1 Tax=Castanea mollissima TaxID=60419 RepID=A0A8J4QX52_9ROSI|nr:hypothetical protein CMV_014801 [Castanea mollissima]